MEETGEVELRDEGEDGDDGEELRLDLKFVIGIAELVAPVLSPAEHEKVK